MAKGKKGAFGVNFNTMTTDEGINVAVRVKSVDESFGECVNGLFISAKEGCPLCI